MGTEMMWFGIGVVVTVALFCIAGILAARRERKVRFYADILLPQDRHYLVHTAMLSIGLTGDATKANCALLSGLRLIERAGDHYALTRLGRQVAQHTAADYNKTLIPGD